MIHWVTRRGWLLDVPYLSTLKFCSESKLFLSKVMILESGETRLLEIGVVFGDCGKDSFPGWKEGAVGYRTGDRRIFTHHGGKKTIGL